MQESQNTEDDAKPQSREQQMKNFKDNLIEPDDLLTRSRAVTTNQANDESGHRGDHVRGESIVLSLKNQNRDRAGENLQEQTFESSPLDSVRSAYKVNESADQARARAQKGIKPVYEADQKLSYQE